MKGLALYESVTGHTEMCAKWLAGVMAKLDPSVELLLKDITNACMIRPDAPCVFEHNDDDKTMEDYQGISFIIVMGPVYCFRPDDGLTNLLKDKKRFNLPEHLRNLPMFGCLFCENIVGGSNVYLYEQMRAESYDVRKTYGLVSPMMSKPNKDKSFCEKLKEVAIDIIKLSQLDKAKSTDRVILKDIEDDAKVSKITRVFGHTFKQGGLGCRIVGHHKCKIENNCIGCGRCVAVCMRGVLGMGEQDGKTPKKAVLLDPSGCLGCGRCYKVCPVHAISKPTHKHLAKNWSNAEYERLYGEI